ncbi:MAG TPA: DUF433 domain-containing protein [Tepidisphaeraceae bacterium]
MNFNRITVDPAIMQGKPCVRGMRITVGLVVNLVANSMSVTDILRNYPNLEEEDIQQCLRYAASLAEDRIAPYEEPTVALHR